MEDVVWALAQGRYVHLHDRQAVEKIFAEAARPDLRREIAVRGRDDADIGSARATFAHTFELLFLDETQKLGLNLGRDFCDLIEEQRSSLGGLHASRSIPDRTGEGTPGVAEELAREELSAQRGTVHEHEGSPAPRALRVEDTREDPFAGSTLAAQQDGGFRGGSPGDRLENAAHGGRHSVDVDFRTALLQLLLELEQAPPGAAQGCDLLDHVPDLLRGEGFGQIVGGAALHGLHSGVHRGVRSDDHDHKPRTLGQKAGEEIEPACRAKPQVEKREIERPLGEGGERRVTRGHGTHLAAHPLKAHAERHANVLVVIDHEDAQGGKRACLLAGLGLHVSRAYRRDP